MHPNENEIKNEKARAVEIREIKGEMVEIKAEL